MHRKGKARQIGYFSFCLVCTEIWPQTQIRDVLLYTKFHVCTIKICCLLRTCSEPDRVSGSQLGKCADRAEGAEMHRLRDLKKTSQEYFLNLANSIRVHS